MLTVKNLTVSIEKKKILSAVSLHLAQGKTYALMGPNGSGKSTLAMTLMGHPAYTIARGGSLTFLKKNITKQSTDERARLGLFLSVQNPLPLPGVSVKDLLRIALEKKYTPQVLHKKIITLAKELRIKDELLTRSLNEGFSGGEKKKLEALQAVLLAPKLAIFDELDTGVDVDAIKTIGGFLKRHLPKETTTLYITHSTRLLKYLKADHVLIMKDGRVVKQGGHSLAQKIEEKGFDWVKSDKK